MRATKAVKRPTTQQKLAFLRGVIRMAQEDAADVKVILVAGGFVETNPDGSIECWKNGWFKSCLLPKHTVAALGLVVRLRRWEQLHFDGHRAAGIPSAEDVLAHVAENICSARPSRRLKKWQALRWEVYRDHVAWLGDHELIVYRDPSDNPDLFAEAIAEFVLATTLNTQKRT
jgi:hypothetical protein